VNQSGQRVLYMYSSWQRNPDT